MKEYIRVVLDGVGRVGHKDEAAFCKENGMSAGYFYVVSPAENSTPTDRTWAWKADSRVIADHLEDVLATKLAAQKSS